MWLLIVIAIACFFCYSWQKLRYFSSRGVKTVPPIPFFGNLTAVTFGRENFVEALAKGYDSFKNERYFGFYQYLVPTVIPRDPELIRQIMVRDFNSFTDRGVHIPTDCDPLFGKNLFMIRGSRWRAMRVKLSPAFSGARIRCMTPLMDASAAAVAEYLADRVHRPTLMDVNEITMAYMNDVIASCAFGIGVDSLKDPDNVMFALGQRAVIQDTAQVMKFFGYANMTTVMKMLKVRIISADDANRFTALFTHALSARRAGTVLPRPDFIQTLVDAAEGILKESEDNNNNEEKLSEKVLNESDEPTGASDPKLREKFDDQDLLAQMLIFYIAGYDTTTNLINYFLYEMACHRHLQDRLQRHLDGIGEGELYDEIQAVEYLDMCVNEVLRLWPPVGSYDRTSVAAYDFGPTHPGSKHRLVAPPGVHVWFPAYSIHRDARHWPAPHTCDPERFSAENKHNIAPYTFIPFGFGPRHCIGSRFALLAAKVFLARFLKDYCVRRTASWDKLSPRAFVLRPAHGHPLIVEPRPKIGLEA